MYLSNTIIKVIWVNTAGSTGFSSFEAIPCITPRLRNLPSRLESRFPKPTLEVVKYSTFCYSWYLWFLILFHIFVFRMPAKFWCLVFSPSLGKTLRENGRSGWVLPLLAPPGMNKHVHMSRSSWFIANWQCWSKIQSIYCSYISIFKKVKEKSRFAKTWLDFRR